MDASETCCFSCGEPIAADASPGVWLHDPALLGERAYDLDEAHVALPENPELPHPAEAR